MGMLERSSIDGINYGFVNDPFLDYLWVHRRPHQVFTLEHAQVQLFGNHIDRADTLKRNFVGTKWV